MATYLELSAVEDLLHTVDGILSAVDPDDIASPACLLYEHLTGGDVEETAEDLRSRVQAYQNNGNQIIALVTRVIIRLLTALKQSDAR